MYNRIAILLTTSVKQETNSEPLDYSYDDKKGFTAFFLGVGKFNFLLPYCSRFQIRILVKLWLGSTLSSETASLKKKRRLAPILSLLKSNNAGNG